MSVTYIDDHVVRAHGRLLEQYKGKDRISGLITAFVAQVQDLEASFQDLNLERGMDTAVGAQLDQLGVIIGLERVFGQSDVDYRVLLKIRIIQNLNQGTPEEVIAAAKFFMGAEFVRYQEVYPAAIDLFTTTSVPEADRDAVRAQVKKFLPAGVSLGAFGSYDETNPFVFDGGEGFGDAADPESGALLAEIY